MSDEEPGKAYIKFGDKNVVATPTDYDRVVPLPATGPTYPDLIERLEQESDRRKREVHMYYLAGQWCIYFGESLTEYTWYSTLQEAALAALRR